MIEVFSTARQIRDFYESFSQTDSILPKVLTIAEFESKAWITPNLVEASEDTRLLLMRECSAFANFERLHIPKEFTAFLTNSNYIFRLFEELANEEVDISELDISDTYAEFGEHIAILKELLQRYVKALEQKGLYDSITKPKIAKINSSYLSSLRGIRVRLEGFLSKFEIRMLEEVKKICPAHIVVPITLYNKKTQAWLKEEGAETKPNTLIEYDMSGGKTISVEKLYDKKPKIFYQTFSSRVIQTAFVFEKIETFVKNNILPQNIAVVLPDESFASILKELDVLGNLNFAMGFGMSLSKYYQRLKSILNFDDEIEHALRLSRLELSAFADLKQKASSKELILWLSGFIREDDDKNENDIIKNELFLFEKFLEEAGNLTYEQAAILFLQRLERQRIDDKEGGKVTVIGILESRGVKYEGVIIVDFNDDIVPKRSGKDMFISSNVRARCALPSVEDRENLQRFFYDRLINNAKMAAICCVENEDKLPSRFLKSLNLTSEQKDELSYKQIIFKPSALKAKPLEKVFAARHDFFEKPLSHSRLKSFLECERRYYFFYIKGYKEAKIPSNEYDARSFGAFIHQFLNELFKRDISSFERLKKDASEIMESSRPKGDIWKLEGDIWLLKLEEFFKNEIKRKEEGWRVFALEKRAEKEFDGFLIEGVIDRIDKRGSEYLLLDYKSGKISTEKSEEKALESRDFQLEFYSLLFEEASNAAFYSLSEAKLIENPYFDLKREKLKERLNVLKKQKEFEFAKTDDIKRCLFCPFDKLCERAL
jgi:RecB family exonuclease